MTTRIGLSAGILLAALSGCSLGLHSKVPVVQTYVLKVLGAPQTHVGSNTIQVSRPQAIPGLDTERIAILMADHKGDYYSGAQWPGALPDVIESLVIERLRLAGRWGAVQGSRSAFPAEYLLQLRIRQFDAEYRDQKSAPDIVVAFDGTLGRRTDREVLATFSVTAAAKAAENRLGAVVGAFETATNAALDELEAQAGAALQNVPRPVDSSKR